MNAINRSYCLQMLGIDVWQCREKQEAIPRFLFLHDTPSFTFNTQSYHVAELFSSLIKSVGLNASNVTVMDCSKVKPATELRLKRHVSVLIFGQALGEKLKVLELIGDAMTKIPVTILQHDMKNIMLEVKEKKKLYFILEKLKECLDGTKTIIR